MVSEYELNSIVNGVILNPSRIFAYKNDIQTFERIIQELFKKSRLGTTINTLDKQSENNEEVTDDEQLLYDISYKYIPRKMNDNVGDEIIKKTSEKTIQRLIKSRDNRYYDYLPRVDEIINERFDLYPWQTYSKETLETIYLNSSENLYIFKEIFGLLDPYQIVNCYELTFDVDKKLMIVDIVYKSFDEEKVKKLSEKISNEFIRNPQYLKYYDGELNKYALIAIIGKAIKSNKFEEIKNILLSKNISEKRIKTIAKLFELSYNHDLDSEIIFDD